MRYFVLTSRYKVIIIAILFVHFSVSKASAEGNQQKVETASEIDARLLQEKKSPHGEQSVSWFSRYFSLLNDFQKMEKELLAYKSFFASWDIPVGKGEERISRNLFEEIERIKKKLQDSVSKLDKIRLNILLSEDIEEKEKDVLFRTILQLTEDLKNMYSVPNNKGAEKGQVMNVNSKLNCVIINLGIQNNVFEGSYWQVRRGEQVVVELEALLVRKEFFLARLIKGNISDITVKDLVERNIKK